MPLLDGLTPEAERLHAVNVILRDGCRLIGDTTDGAGYLAALREEGYQPKGKRVLLVGAGGAAKAVGVALADVGVAEVWILNRTVTRAESVARLLADVGLSHVRVGLLVDVASALRQVDLVVNATSVGLQKEAPPLFDYGLLRPPVLVSDLVFFPRETLFLRQAREQGCRTLNGLGTLLHQAALSFERWTGRPAAVPMMRNAVLEALEARERNA